MQGGPLCCKERTATCKRLGQGKEIQFCVIFFYFAFLVSYKMFLCLRVYKIIPFYPGSYFLGEKETLFSQESFDKENML